VERVAVTYHLYYAASIDGFIADRDGGVGWLDAFINEEYGYEGFVAELDSVVMGRRTYEQSVAFGGTPYAGKRIFILSSHAFAGDGVETHDNIEAISARVHSEGLQNTWIVGGAQTMAAFCDRGLVDRIQHFIIPVTLGAGVPIFRGADAHNQWTLAGTTTYPNGVVQLGYMRNIQ
jgi:dihydrofolate reductase